MENFGKMITDVIKNFADTIEKLVSENFGILYELVYPVWVVGVAVYFLFVIYSMIYQGRDVDPQEFIKQMAVLALITAFLGTAGKNGVYISKVVPFVMNTGDTLSSAIMGGKSSSALVESLFIKTSKMINQLWADAGNKGWLDDKVGAVIMASINSVLLFIGGILLAIFAFVYIVITKMMIGILLSLGGVFIMFSAYPPTRGMFTAWVGSCFNYIFLNVSFSISFSVIMSVSETYTQLDGVKSIMGSIAIAFLYISGILLLQQITVMTSSLTGGVGINGLTSAVRSALPEKTAGKLGKAVGGYAWGKTGAPVARKAGQGWNSAKSAMKDALGFKNNNIRG